MSIAEAGVKHDAGKPRMDLLNPEFLLEMGRVMKHGSEEYGNRNWEKGIAYGRLYAAILRHALGFWKGEPIDRESGLKALAHVAVDAMMLASMSAEWDDRPNGSFSDLDENPGFAYGSFVRTGGFNCERCC